MLYQECNLLTIAVLFVVLHTKSATYIELQFFQVHCWWVSELGIFFLKHLWPRRWKSLIQSLNFNETFVGVTTSG